MYYVYMLRCVNNSIYTGITTDVERRFKEHIRGVGAKYTKVNKVTKIEKVFVVQNVSEALKVEREIKKLPKLTKEKLIMESDFFIEKLKEKRNIEIFLIK